MKKQELDDVLTRVLGGHVDAYEAIVRAYQSEVWKVVSAMLFNGQRTEDLVQQTFINAYQHIHRYQLGRDFGIWLKEIARNEVRQELRRRMREEIVVWKYIKLMRCKPTMLSSSPIQMIAWNKHCKDARSNCRPLRRN